MTRDSKRLLDDVLRLPESDRAEVAARLIESLEGKADSDVDAVWAAEIERRCASLDAGYAVTSDWKEVRRRIDKEIFG